ncbi:acyltransferase [Thalassospira lucentensis]|uniref:acyltransferase n=1 Tax=Thalassospira lucentensis TaxID=168935 RepID=UPI003D2844F3
MNISRFFKLLASESREWFWVFVEVAPGLVGAHLRRKLFRMSLKSFGDEVFIDRGVRFVGGENISVGASSGFMTGCFLAASAGKIVIGSGVSFNRNVFIGADFGLVTIGDNVMIGPNVVLRSANHRFDVKECGSIRQQGHEYGEIEISQDVWIGANSTLLAGAKLGSRTVVGAGSVVRGVFPPNVMIAGVPAKIIKHI